MSDHDTKEQQEAPPFALPPVSFAFLTESLRLQAEMQLGLMRTGSEDEPPNLDLARHTIDVMALLQEKTKGNLTLEEQRLLENSLTMLRFRYVQAADEAKKAEEAKKSEEAKPTETGQAASQPA